MRKEGEEEKGGEEGGGEVVTTSHGKGRCTWEGIRGNGDVGRWIVA
jgi:hypothetical protein